MGMKCALQLCAGLSGIVVDPGIIPKTRPRISTPRAHVSEGVHQQNDPGITPGSFCESCKGCNTCPAGSKGCKENYFRGSSFSTAT